MRAFLIAALLLLFCAGCGYDPASPLTPCDKERMRGEGRQKRQQPTACDEWLDKQSKATQDAEKRMRPVKPGPKRVRPVKPGEADWRDTRP